MGFCHGSVTIGELSDRFGQPWPFPKRRKWFKIRRSFPPGA
jgi:hypothetical protein